MAQQSKSGDQTEKATPKRLREAREKGDVAKSKDMTSTLVLGAWLAVGLLAWPLAYENVRKPFTLALDAVAQPSIYQMKVVGLASVQAFTAASLMLLAPVAALGVLADFVQVGAVFTTKKMSPKLDHLNPADGLKRMFSKDNLFEVGKSLLKAAAVIAVMALVIAAQFPKIANLPDGGPAGAFAAMGSALFQLGAATAVVFALVSTGDLAYQRFAFARKMRMSRREIRQESKDAEGDPQLKGRRRQLHQEWASRNVVEAARGATALVMNPTHIAVALAYDPEEHPAPIVSGKGMGALAMQMRDVAEQEGVPVIRNVALARTLNARAVVDDIVPPDMFAAVAEVIVFARRMRDEAARADPPAAEDASA